MALDFRQSGSFDGECPDVAFTYYLDHKKRDIPQVRFSTTSRRIELESF